MQFSEPFGGVLPGARGAVLAALLRTGAPMTGRQVYGLVRDRCSLWSVQQALTSLVGLGVVTSQAVGRATVHAINEDHYAVQPLRVLLDPFAALRETVQAAVGSDVKAVLLFGSVARGETTADSDVDLVVLAGSDWNGRSELEDAVRARLGNDCDVLVLTPDQFSRHASEGDEPVVAQILTDGVALVGSLRDWLSARVQNVEADTWSAVGRSAIGSSRTTEPDSLPDVTAQVVGPAPGN